MSPRSALFAIVIPLLATNLSGCDDTPDDMADYEVDEDGEIIYPGPPEDRPAPATSCEGEERYESCRTEDGQEGRRYCVATEEADIWTSCEVSHFCQPDDYNDMGCFLDYCYWDGESLEWYSWTTADPECYTPLVVNFEREALSFTAATSATFDIAASGQCMSTDWPTLPWLALDRNKNGIIEDGSELFGSGTTLASGGKAQHGFEALIELDANHDGQITAQDPAFNDLVLWSDTNGDRRGTMHEQISVAAADLVAIHLDYQRKVECDDRGNCGAERSAFEFRSNAGKLRTGEIVDVYLPCQ